MSNYYGRFGLRQDPIGCRETRIIIVAAVALAIISAAVILAPVCRAEDYGSYRTQDYGPYRGRIVRAVDGDTVEAEIRVWPYLIWRGSVRLRGIDTPELHGRACERGAAEAARTALAGYQGQAAVFLSVAPDKFRGRMDAVVRVGAIDLAAAQIAAGHARAYGGGRRKPWCEDQT